MSPVLWAQFIVLALWSLAMIGNQSEGGIFGDASGKWLLIQSIISGETECSYRESFDPGFEYIPGPWYFYSIRQGVCLYGYQYLFGVITAPFVSASPGYGFQVLNLLLLLSYAAALSFTARRMLPGRPWAVLLAGVSAVVLIPGLTFALDLSEMLLAMAPGAWALYLATPSFEEDRERSAAASWDLRAAGFLIGALLLLRMEAALYFASLAAALQFTGRGNAREGSWMQNALLRFRTRTLQFSAGFALAAALVVGFNLLFLGSPFGVRNEEHVSVSGSIDWMQRLEIARTLLFGGNLGLISSFPAFVLIFLILAPAVRRKLGEQAQALAIIALLQAVVIPFIAPNDSGYSWGPRYFAFSFSAFVLFLVHLPVKLPDSRGQQTLAWSLAAVIGIHAAWFSHRGVTVLHSATRQNALYAAEIARLNPDAIIIDHPSTMSAFAAGILRYPIYQAKDQPALSALLPKLWSYRQADAIVYVRAPFSPPAFQANDRLPSPWRAHGLSSVRGLEFVLIKRETDGTGGDEPQR